MNRESDNSNIKKTPVILTVGEKKIRAVIYDNKTGRDVLSRLPYTITLNRYEMDYCGTLKEPLAYDEKEKHNGWKNGDIDLAGNYFSILFDGEEKSQSYTDMITFGRIEEDLSIVKGLGGTIKVTITPAD
ncbi:MAG TPA: cyclophilin-like fold protein [Spirochaetota bacterium]|nr:cyclophilin-like fold protein [Spirochaetota bacterium]HPJ36460.1 cyclophilin-like fold protein [Spirochaetota bacterium]